MKNNSLIFGKKENDYTLNQLNKIFIKNRGYITRIPKKNDSVVLLLSGGLDSVSLWALLLDKYKFHVYPFHIKPIGKAAQNKQKKAMEFFTKFFKNKYPKLFHAPKVIDNTIQFSFPKILKDTYSEKIGKNLDLLIPNIHKVDSQYVSTIIGCPSRLAHYAFNAYDYINTLKYSHNIDIKTIFIALTSDDASVLRESSLTSIRSINLSMCSTLGDFEYQFISLEDPNCFYTKKSLVQYAAAKDVPLKDTWSCLNNWPSHCGYCYNCRDRQRVFKELKINDKTTYFSSTLRFKIYKKVMNLKDKLLNKDLKTITNTKSNKINLDINTKLKISKNIIYKEINGFMYIRNCQTDEIEKMNETATLVLKSLRQSSRSTLELIKILKEVYPKTKVFLIKDDVIKFINEQIAENRIEVIY